MTTWESDESAVESAAATREDSMQIDPTNYSGPLTGPSRRLARPRARVERDEANFARTESLNRSLEQTPDVRPAAVAHARTLVADAQYPSAEVLGGVAQLLAGKLTGPSE